MNLHSSTVIHSLIIFLSFYVKSTISQSQVCVIGALGDIPISPSYSDGIYEANRDPRLLMGTYTLVDDNTTDPDIVDIDYPIYEHENYLENNNTDNPESYYLFKVKQKQGRSYSVGWVLSDTFPALGAPSVTVYATCLKPDLDTVFDCGDDRWYWGWNSYSNPVSKLKVLGGSCQENMCMDNLTIVNIPDSTTNTTYNVDVSGHLTKTADLSNERGYVWINDKDPDLKWYYREGIWVYGDVGIGGGDRMVCVPGGVEMPAFCTSFVYAGNQTDYVNEWEFKLGVCGDTTSPTIEPTLEPTNLPTIEPTYKPTPTPRCRKEFIFPATDALDDVTISCPFGYRGNNATRECLDGGIWSYISNDCELISFTDDFTYFRDELWEFATGSEYDVDYGYFDSDLAVYSLQSYPLFRAPFRIDIKGTADTLSGSCGGYKISLSENGTDTFDATWDCAQRTLDIDVDTSLQADSSVVASSSFDVEGFIIYRFDATGTTATAIYQSYDTDTPIILTNLNMDDPQLLWIGLADDTTGRMFRYNQLSYTTFIDWFNPPNTDPNSIWSTYPSNSFPNYTTTSFPNINIDLLLTTDVSYYIELTDADYLVADDSSFAFISPFTVGLIYGIEDFETNSIGSDFTITLTTTEAARSLFITDDTNYPITTLTVQVANNSLSMMSSSDLGSNEDSLVFNISSCDWSQNEIYAELYVAESNITLTLYDNVMAVCAILEMDNTNITDSSSLNWDSLQIAGSTSGGTVDLAYIAVTSNNEPDIITNAPSQSPTMSPTIECYNASQWLADRMWTAGDEDDQGEDEDTDTDFTIFSGTNITAPCPFGYRGEGIIGICMVNMYGMGVISVLDDRCFKISFRDDFNGFDHDQWFVNQTQGVSGDATISYTEEDDDATISAGIADGSLKFIPDDPALVGIIRSYERITFPMRVTSIVEKRYDECNLWSIALGKEWGTRKPSSTRINWGCIGGGSTDKQMSLYNSTFRLYDSRCWKPSSDDSGYLAEDGDTDSMEVIYTIRSSGLALVDTDSSDCATLKLQVSDIVDQPVGAWQWDNAYLWLGSYYDSEFSAINTTIVGRFREIAYTQFFTSFTGQMDHLWDTLLSTTSEDDTKSDAMVTMDIGESLVGNTSYFQFTFPFYIKLQLYRYNSSQVWAHYITLGSTEYIDGKEDEIVQIVWDSYPEDGVKLVYTAEKVYEAGYDNPLLCDFTQGDDNDEVTIDVEIWIDNETIIIEDELCPDGRIVAKHDLPNQLTKLSLGMIDTGKNKAKGKDASQTVSFKYIEVNQYAESASADLQINDVAVNAETSSVIIDLEDLYPPDKGEDDDILVYILIAIGIFLVFLIIYIVLAKKQNWCPWTFCAVGVGSDGEHLNKSLKDNDQQQNLVQNDDLSPKNLNSNNPNNNSSNAALLAKQKQEQEAAMNKPIPNSFAAMNSGAQAMNQQNQGMSQSNASNQLQQQQQMMSNQQGLQYQMYQQQLFYQQQFMQMMMTNPQQQAILMNMNPMQRKQYIQTQMMVYMSQVAQMQMNQQQNGGVSYQMQQAFMQESGGAGGEGGEGGGTGGTGAFMEGDMGNTNAMANMGMMGNMGMQQQNPQMQQQQQQMQMQQQQMQQMGMQQQPQQIEMQQMGMQQQMGGAMNNGYGGHQQIVQQEAQYIESTYDIKDQFYSKVDVDTFYSLCPAGNDGQRRSDLNRSRLMVGKYRGVNPMEVNEMDECIGYIANLTQDELVENLENIPESMYQFLIGPNEKLDESFKNKVGDERECDFLNSFLEKVNLKQIYDKLKQDLGQEEPLLDAHHSRIVIANLRDQAFGQVHEMDQGIQMIDGKSLPEMRVYLSCLTLAHLRVLAPESYPAFSADPNHGKNVQPPAMNDNDNDEQPANGGGGGGDGGFVFPVVNFNYNGNIQQFNPTKFGCFGEMMAFIMNTWSLQQYQLMYDMDGQWVRITSDIDIQECMKVAMETGEKVLNISIQI